MEIKFSKNSISLDQKELTTLDKLVIKFIEAMDDIDYVIVSGYIAIFFSL